MMALNPGESLAPAQVTLQHLLHETRAYLSPMEMEKIQRAYELANQAHKGVLRRSGEPYILHPLEVALLLADMRIDADGIVAALLHDVVEDTDSSLNDLREHFGDAVSKIVDGVTKFDAITTLPESVTPESGSERPSDEASASSEKSVTEQPTGEQQLARERELKHRMRSETVRKMLLAMVEDPRVVVLKLADRLHNMRTLGVMKPVQQQNTARETSEIYAPLARRLGMGLVQAELEDLALSYLEPERYAKLAREIEEERRKRQPYVEEVSRILQEEMDRAGIHAEVYAWQKHLASINRKLLQSGGDVGQIHDLVSFRILVDSEHDCYLALGRIHALWRPKDGRIKDFIATPKLNGYQSLHTTVFCLDNRLAEIHIRTHDMQRKADYGIASYWYLKERGESGLSYREMIAWVEQLRDWQRELPQSADEFVEAVKGDLFEEQIFVFTPKGEIKDLPRGSTPLDMAYRIHSDIGDHCAGARIITNMADTERLVTRLVPLDYELKSGEIVDIVTKRTVHPTSDWLSFARTTSARAKIRRYLKTYEREINLQLGQERLDQALKTLGTSGLTEVKSDDFASFTTVKKYASPEDIYVALGREDLTLEKVLEHLVPLMENRGIHVRPLENEVSSEDEETIQNKYGNNGAKGESLTKVIQLAHCCCPIPNDPVVGFLHANKGMMVHRTNCRTLRRYREQASEQFVEISWPQIEAQSYLAPIIIIAHDRAGLLRDVAAVVSDAGINMTTVASTTNPSVQKAIINATLEIESVDQIERVAKRLLQVRNVVSVNRDLGRRVG
ncbi:MAG TPA: bifunctional (p)ppGpp synthetase/guanosine-3',5'-bis(diphosphate) 3'-pyrophosphohydrolase [Ktedonobacteraceae bacterium]|nr:bifunctional (p)ppGpp synthetase/guanosine-3',5'-bis(diphosphate) 3'-pyrophosphohydrolase [Ktedonobacteraceae bacterium]